MKTNQLREETLIAAPRESVWRFFSSPHNLQRLTPPYMHFRIADCPDTAEIFEGMRIEYRISPLCGIPLKWVTLIRNVSPPFRFTDLQQKGPYALWEHTHTFEEVPGGTLMTDEVRYAMPFGILGSIAHGMAIKKQLGRIFSYRRSRIAALFAGT